MVNLDELHRREYGHLLTSHICMVKDFDLAEDALQEAFAAARHKVIDQLCRRVLAVVYLVFNEGYAAGLGAELVRADLCVEAIACTFHPPRALPAALPALSVAH